MLSIEKETAVSIENSHTYEGCVRSLTDALFHAMRQSRFLAAGFISRDPSRKGVTNRNSFKTAGNGIWEP